MPSPSPWKPSWLASSSTLSREHVLAAKQSALAAGCRVMGWGAGGRTGAPILVSTTHSAFPCVCPQVCLAAGAEVASLAQAEGSPRRSQAGRRASSESPPRVSPETECSPSPPPSWWPQDCWEGKEGAPRNPSHRKPAGCLLFCEGLAPPGPRPKLTRAPCPPWPCGAHTVGVCISRGA